MRINPMVKKDIKVQARSMRICWEIFAYEAIMAVVFFFAMFFVFPADDLFVCKHIQQHCLAVSGTCGHADFYSGSGSPGAHGFCNFG